MDGCIMRLWLYRLINRRIHDTVIKTVIINIIIIIIKIVGIKTAYIFDVEMANSDKSDNVVTGRTGKGSRDPLISFQPIHGRDTDAAPRCPRSLHGSTGAGRACKLHSWEGWGSRWLKAPSHWGVEAVGCAAFDAGIKGVFGYPRTTSTDCFEFIEPVFQSEAQVRAGDRVAHWAANEKAAYELALGMSYAGHRTLLTI
jgi:hypothetical protein